MMAQFFRSLLAGMLIGIAGATFLTIGGITGAILFSFGLLVIITHRLTLFTGKAYQFWGSRYGELLCMLWSNWIGVGFVAAWVAITPEISHNAEMILTKRLTQGWFQCGGLAILCGFILTYAVKSGKTGNWWPLLLGVPTFVLCGLPHCVADMFYVCCCTPEFVKTHFTSLIIFFISIVVGNYLGCNMYRLTNLKH